MPSYSRNHDNFYQCKVFIHLQAKCAGNHCSLSYWVTGCECVHALCTAQQRHRANSSKCKENTWEVRNPILYVFWILPLAFAINHHKESGLKVKWMKKEQYSNKNCKQEKTPWKLKPVITAQCGLVNPITWVDNCKQQAPCFSSVTVESSSSNIIIRTF